MVFTVKTMQSSLLKKMDYNYVTVKSVM